MIFGDGYEYEVERDEQALFSRPMKGDGIRSAVSALGSKRRRVDTVVKEEDELLSDIESDRLVLSDDEAQAVRIWRW